MWNKRWAAQSRKWAILTAAAMLLTACASAGDPSATRVNDPYEGLNRGFHKVNKSLDEYALRPASIGAAAVTPDLVRFLLRNGLAHLGLVGDFANRAFQGDGMAALEVFGRFTVNTVLGAGGLLDPATEFGLPREETDFGETLATWGVGAGPYFEIPLIGPRNTRHAVGGIVDMAFNPLLYVGQFTSAVDGLSPALNVGSILDTRERNLSLVDSILYESPDSYVTLRSIYLQRRRAQIQGDEVGEDDLPDIPE